MATKKIRVYELARELGVENAVVLDLANELKIGVKSHSSSIDDPSADRVRRLADSKGLRREPVVEEPEPEPAPPPPEPEKVPAVEKAPAPVAEPAEPAVAPPPPHRVVRSTGGLPEPAPLAPRPAPAREPAPAPGERREEAPAASDAAAPPAPPAAPRSPSGRPIPPPPGQRPVSPSGPPRTGAPRTGGAPSGAPRGGPGGGRGGGFPRGGPSGPPGGGPPGGRGGYQGRGRPGPQGQRPRRKKRRRRNFEDLGPAEHPQLTPTDAPVPEGEIVVPRGSTIQELAPKLNRTTADLVRLLFDAGEMVTGTQSLADEMVDLIAEALGAEVLLVEPGQEAELELQALLGDDDDEDDANLEPRAPIVTVLGHVDHGKTTLLDTIRNANVVAGEAGGITQHIGAYKTVFNGAPITFIDTPGHEAFTAMRARGANATDIAILVVAADDGVMPQTREAVAHAKAAGVPIVVALNKIDKDNADPQRVLSQLAEHELVPESWGGDTIVVEMAASQGLGVDDLLEQLAAVAELEDLNANPEGRAKGIVLEAKLDVGRGPVATVLVDKGELKVGDPIVAGAAWGRVRAMINDKGEQVKAAGPSTPVQVLGLASVPEAGDEFRAAPDEKTARIVGEAREYRLRMKHQRGDARVKTGTKLEDIFAQIQSGETATLNLVLKADVHGSLEAVTESLRKLDRPEVELTFVHRAVGGITENDISLAATTNATIIGFNVRPDRKARELADAENVEIRTYEIIYKLLEDIEQAMVGMLAPEFVEVVTGEAEVREIFRVPRIGAIAGCFVRSGVITRGSKVRFLRDGTIIWKGSVTSLKRFKDDATEVRAGFECGIGLSDFQDLKPGDVIETYEEQEIART